MAPVFARNPAVRSSAREIGRLLDDGDLGCKRAG
jgi:hypothetical protein